LLLFFRLPSSLCLLPDILVRSGSVVVRRQGRMLNTSQMDAQALCTAKIFDTADNLDRHLTWFGALVFSRFLPPSRILLQKL
jgi:hypothetical protein